MQKARRRRGSGGFVVSGSWRHPSASMYLKEFGPTLGLQPSGRQARMAGCRIPGAIQFEKRLGDGMETEGTAFSQDDAGRQTPDFDDEGFGHGPLLGHEARSLERVC